MHELCLRHGEDHLAAVLIPLALDGLIVVASMSIPLANRYGSRGGLLVGELRPTRGTIRHSGRVGYCPQQVVLNDALTVRQHLAFFQAPGCAAADGQGATRGRIGR